MPRKRVLIAEDNPLNRDLLVQLLENMCEVIEAENGLEAVEKAHSDAPDLILMDMSMPVLSGWDATQMLKRREPTREIPVVAVTARTMDDEVRRAHSAGVDEFVSLPLDETQLFSVLQRFLGLPRPAPVV
jgi:CheY-like chemotaxis protein